MRIVWIVIATFFAIVWLMSGDGVDQRQAQREQQAPPAQAPKVDSKLEFRKKVFYDLVSMQDQRPDDAEWGLHCYAMIAAVHGLEERKVREIAIEGATNKWPMPK
jgi:hypothetical protein